MSTIIICVWILNIYFAVTTACMYFGMKEFLADVFGILAQCCILMFLMYASFDDRG